MKTLQSDMDLREVPISVLAYIGDAVYELYVRLHTSSQCQGKSGQLHRRAVRLVKATAQADAMRRLMPMLEADELAVFRRGRNSQPPSRSRHADLPDYLAATGLEALVGYLYMQKRQDRLDELMSMILEESDEQII